MSVFLLASTAESSMLSQHSGDMKGRGILLILLSSVTRLNITNIVFAHVHSTKRLLLISVWR